MEEREAFETSLPLGNKGPLKRFSASVTTRDNKWSAQAGLHTFFSVSSSAMASCNVFLMVNQSLRLQHTNTELSFFWGTRTIRWLVGVWEKKGTFNFTCLICKRFLTPVKSHGQHLLKLLCVCRVWGFREPEPYFCHGGDGWNIWAAEVQQIKSALRVLPTTGIALELPPQSIPTFKGQYIPLFSTLVFWKLRDFKMRDIFKLYKEICS